MAVSMFGMILIPFAFILLVLLLVKAPKAGIALIGTVVVAAIALAGIRFLRLGDGVSPVGLTGMVAVPFSFVLLVVLLVKAPKAGATLIGFVVFMVAVGLIFLVPTARRQRTEHTILYEQSGRQRQQSDGLAAAKVEFDRVFEDFAVGEAPSYAIDVVDNEMPPVTSPIWSDGVEDEYEADVYPSKIAAARALAPSLRDWTQQVLADANDALTVVLFQEDHARTLIWELEGALEEDPNGIPCSIRAGLPNTDRDEIGIQLRFEITRTASVPWDRQHRMHVTSGRIVGSVHRRGREKSFSQSFTEKPWVENFASFASEKPEQHYVVARSRSACTSENEARNQALRDARDQVAALVAQKWPGRPAATISSTDLLEGGFVLDQFLQSFDGMSGRIYRQAMLIDTSAQKLSWLGSRKAAVFRVERITWAGMILSAIGVLLVIIIAYLFLNMATKGYYVWSLRVAGTILAVAGVISILLVLR